MEEHKRSRRVRIISVLSVVLAIAFIGWILYWKATTTSVHQIQNVTNTTSNTPQKSQVNSQAVTATAISPEKIPLGDNKVSSTAKSGYVMSCQTSFRTGGAQHSGDWIGSTTWNSTTKPSVAGHVDWPNAKVSTTTKNSTRVISTNDLPLGSHTGTFPIALSDPAYQFDTNPNRVISQNITVGLPQNPLLETTPICVPMGAIGYMDNGVALFSALDDTGRDAAAHEVQDDCDGHPQMIGEYHYHSLSKCLLASVTEKSKLIGYASDGFGIFIEKNDSGNLPTNADLDECHGRTSEIDWDGKQVNMFHYVMTTEYPYSIGCFRGTPVRTRA